MTDPLSMALRDRLAEAAQEIHPGPDLLIPVARRYRRRRSARRVVIGTAIAASLVAAVAVALPPKAGTESGPAAGPVAVRPTERTALDPAVTITLAGHVFAMPDGFTVTQKPMTAYPLIGSTEGGGPPWSSTTAVAQLPSRTASRTNPPTRLSLSYFEGRLQKHDDWSDLTRDGWTTRPIEVAGHPGTLATLSWTTVQRDCTPMPRHGTTPGIRCEGPFPKLSAVFRLSGTTRLDVVSYGLTEQQVLDVLGSGF